MSLHPRILLLLSLLALSFAFSGKRVNLASTSLPSLDSSDSMTYLTYNDVISVDFAGGYSTPLVIALYTSHTFLNNDCSLYQSFECSEEYSCSREKTTFNADLPYFTTHGTNVHIELSFSDDWSLPYEQNVLYMSTCTDATSTNYYATGLVGFGINGSNIDNFQGTQKFSFDVQNNAMWLLFGYDPTLHTTDDPIEISTNADWNGAYDSIIFDGNYYNTGQSSQVIFDLSLNNIAFPLAAFQNIFDWMKDAGLSCSQKTNADKNYYAECTLASEYQYSDLPSIEVVQSDGSNIIIPPAVYLVNTSSYSSQYYLNLVPTSTDPTGNQLQVTPAYENAVIFGLSMMSYYYVVFDFEDSPVIKLFVSGSPNPAPSPDNTGGLSLAFILAGSLFGSLMALTLCLCCCAKKKKGAKTESKKNKPAPKKTAPETVSTINAEATVSVGPEASRPAENRSLTNTVVTGSVLEDPYEQPRIVSTQWTPPSYNPYPQLPALNGMNAMNQGNQYQPPALNNPYLTNGYYNPLLM